MCQSPGLNWGLPNSRNSAKYPPNPECIILSWPRGLAQDPGVPRHAQASFIALETLHQASFISAPRSFHPGFLEDCQGCPGRLQALPFPGALAPLGSPPTPRQWRTYWALSRTGPKSAPRMHMGRPVWTASNHFTTISPVDRIRVRREVRRGQEEKLVVLMAGNSEMSAPL